MKKAIVFCLAIGAAITMYAQKPVTWNYTAKKIADKTYEIHLKATIQDGWHLYAQAQPENFIGVPTNIKFNKHPLLVLEGKIKEVGEMEISKEPSLDIESCQYSNQVDFVQRVVLKNNAKTSISGSIEYQVCSDELCLQPVTVNFSIVLE
jgi:DsbC/DsbD-like thiol-disulfide interchange protein